MNNTFPTLKKPGNSGGQPLPPAVNGVVMPAWDAAQPDSGQFLQAVLYGAVAALLGCILYAAFTIATGWQFGIVAALVGYMVGWAVLQATGGVGGQNCQILAVVLTYFSVSMASVPAILWYWSSHGVPLTPASVAILVKYGLASPFLRLQHNFGRGLISLIILFYGARTAWRMTAAKRVGM